jgi:hypothetical protein
LWWLELEEAIRRSQTIEVSVAGRKLCFAAGTPHDKTAAYERIYWLLRVRPEAELLEAIGDLTRRAGLRAKRSPTISSWTGASLRR